MSQSQAFKELMSTRVATAMAFAKQAEALVKRSNVAFAAMTKREKRVAIARDVLARLSNGQISAAVGLWVENGEIRTAEDESCRACALGGALIGKIALENKGVPKKFLKRNSWDNGFDWNEPELSSYLRDVFTTSQMEMIENAFEQGEGWYAGYGLGRPTAARFGKAFDDHDERMRLIFENIVANDGTFKPSIKPVQVDGKWTTPGYTQ